MKSSGGTLIKDCSFFAKKNSQIPIFLMVLLFGSHFLEEGWRLRSEEVSSILVQDHLEPVFIAKNKSITNNRKSQKVNQVQRSEWEKTDKDETDRLRSNNTPSKVMSRIQIHLNKMNSFCKDQKKTRIAGYRSVRDFYNFLGGIIKAEIGDSKMIKVAIVVRNIFYTLQNSDDLNGEKLGVVSSKNFRREYMLMFGVSEQLLRGGYLHPWADKIEQSLKCIEKLKNT